MLLMCGILCPRSVVPYKRSSVIWTCVCITGDILKLSRASFFVKLKTELVYIGRLKTTPVNDNDTWVNKNCKYNASNNRKSLKLKHQKGVTFLAHFKITHILHRNILTILFLKHIAVSNCMKLSCHQVQRRVWGPQFQSWRKTANEQKRL